ncbi:MAG: alpha/beta fold hydrolase [Halanaerobium sp.]|nr:alpha/beta fold hydrolase [Halanaerobium sp.]
MGRLPIMEVNELAREYFYSGDKAGCLLLHGFTGSPAEMRLLGNELREEGYTVHGVRLAGHGETVEKMAETGYQDWIKSVEEGYEKLRAETDKIFVMGLSMGGILSLYLAQHKPVEGVISLAAPVRIFSRLAHLSPVLKHIFKFFPPGQEVSDEFLEEKMTGSSDRDLKREYILGYNRVPVRCVHELLKLMRMTRRGLPDIKVPALVIQSRGDDVVRPVSADIIFRELGTEDKKLVWLEESGHIITADCEREQVFAEVKAFIKENN